MKDVEPLGTTRVISRPTEEVNVPHAKLKQFDHEPCGTRVEVDGAVYQKSVAGEAVRLHEEKTVENRKL